MGIIPAAIPILFVHTYLALRSESAFGAVNPTATGWLGVFVSCWSQEGQWLFGAWMEGYLLAG
jgi:hypothetical protein